MLSAVVEIEILVHYADCHNNYLFSQKTKCLKNTHTGFQDECHVCMVVTKNISHQKITLKKTNEIPRWMCCVDHCQYSFFLQKKPHLHTKKSHQNGRCDGQCWLMTLQRDYQRLVSFTKL